jgi:hypothetical protein
MRLPDNSVGAQSLRRKSMADMKTGARAALGGSKGKGKLHIHSMEIRRAHNGGHIVTHHMREQDGSVPENPADATQENAVAPGDLMDHVQASGMADADPSQQQDTQPTAGAE